MKCAKVIFGMPLLIGLVMTGASTAEDKAVDEPPAGTLTDETLQDDVAKEMLKLAEKRLPPHCYDAAVTMTVLKPPSSQVSPWVERWSVTGCGMLLQYRVTFTPDPSPGTGTTFEIDGPVETPDVSQNGKL